MLTVLAALEVTLRELGYESAQPGAGIAAAARVLAESA
jgi:aspartate aminotransferase-like enzyme